MMEEAPAPLPLATPEETGLLIVMRHSLRMDDREANDGAPIT